MTNEEISRLNFKAFPSDSNFNRGITYLDYFASKIASAHINIIGDDDRVRLETAKKCYQMAAAMLEARQGFIK